MSVATAKLRSDLLMSRHGEAEKSFFVIKDPTAERFFRFGETEHFIAQQLDGATSIETVRQRVAERFGASPSMEALQQFIERLRGLGLVTDAGAQHVSCPGAAAGLPGICFIFVSKRLIRITCLHGWPRSCGRFSHRRFSSSRPR